MLRTLQHTATHCNALRHTTTHCNAPAAQLKHSMWHVSTLQHTATHCNTLQHTTAHCNTLQHTCNTAATQQVVNVLSDLLGTSHITTLQHAAAHYTATFCSTSATQQRLGKSPVTILKSHGKFMNEFRDPNEWVTRSHMWQAYNCNTLLQHTTATSYCNTHTCMSCATHKLFLCVIGSFCSAHMNELLCLIDICDLTHPYMCVAVGCCSSVLQ